jgi:glucosylceramidase
VWLTTPDRKALLARRPDVTLTTRAAQGLVVSVDDNRRYQAFRGVGASVTGSSAQLTARLPDASRQRLFTRLFSRGDGIGLSVLRQPLAANDFSVGNHSYDDPPPGGTDEGLGRFSLGGDASLVLPLVRHAREVNESLYVVGTPWSAPAWMKTSGSHIGGTLQPNEYGAYARYLVRTLQAYRAAGVDVGGLTLQNEPSYTPPGYAGMTMSVDQQRALLGRYLAPELAAAGLHPEIYALDDNFDRAGDADALLSDPATRAHLAGVAFHCYRGDVGALKAIRERHPDAGVAISECSGGSWSPHFAGSLQWDVHNLLIQGIRNGASWVVKWNLALDPSGGPANGGCRDCRGVVTIDPSRRTVAYNEDFYALGHVGRFVRPGAQVVASTTYGPGSIETVAFRNPDGGHVLLALNSGHRSRDLSVAWQRRSFGCSLPPGAVATFTW